MPKLLASEQSILFLENCIKNGLEPEKSIGENQAIEHKFKQRLLIDIKKWGKLYKFLPGVAFFQVYAQLKSEKAEFPEEEKEIPNIVEENFPIIQRTLNIKTISEECSDLIMLATEMIEQNRKLKIEVINDLLMRMKYFLEKYPEQAKREPRFQAHYIQY
jgi:hypothetical protein